jgi:hypothetical protein
MMMVTSKRTHEAIASGAYFLSVDLRHVDVVERSDGTSSGMMVSGI